MKNIIAWLKDLWEGVRIVLIFLMAFWFAGFVARLAWGVVMVGWGMV